MSTYRPPMERTDPTTNTKGPTMTCHCHCYTNHPSWMMDTNTTWHLQDVPISFASFEQARAYREARPEIAPLSPYPKVYNWSNAR